MVKGSLLSVFALASCVVDDEVSQVEQELGGQCPIWECGMNSPEVANRGFSWLYENGSYNPDGFRIASFKKGLNTYRPNVINGKLIGTSPTSTISGTALANAIITIQHSSGPTYKIRIRDVDPAVPYFAILGGQTQQPVLQSLVLEWLDAPTQEWKNICKLASLYDGPDNLYMQGEHTLLFDDEILDPASRTIQQKSGVFSLGCAGSAGAKMYLTGHVKAAQVDGHYTTADEQQAMFRMLSAILSTKDVYGNPVAKLTPITVGGAPVVWKDSHGKLSYDPLVYMPTADHYSTLLEARWGKDGAICVNVPRIDANPTPLAITTFPAPNTAPSRAFWALDEHDLAHPPACSNLSPDELDGAYLVTANPPNAI